MEISSETIGGDERYEAPLGTVYLANHDGGRGHMATEDESHNGMPAGEPGSEVKPRLPSLDLEEPSEPVFSDDGGWQESAPASLADHPLLRGLLLELPPKHAVPPPGWLDRWFEATRSILELLYVQGR